MFPLVGIITCAFFSDMLRKNLRNSVRSHEIICCTAAADSLKVTTHFHAGRPEPYLLILNSFSRVLER